MYVNQDYQMETVTSLGPPRKELSALSPPEEFGIASVCGKGALCSKARLSLARGFVSLSSSRTAKDLQNETVDHGSLLNNRIYAEQMDAAVLGDRLPEVEVTQNPLLGNASTERARKCLQG